MTSKKEEEHIYKKRHSLSHILAMSVLEFDSNARLAIGPVIENGFYYDFELSKPLSPNDLPRLEKKMRELIKKNLSFKQKILKPLTAREIFGKEPYKLELIDELVKDGKKISVYNTGSFIDLCSGPHVENTLDIALDSFALTKLAGAYWKGDENNTMLTRIYGLAFKTKEELETYKLLQEKAKENDHRKLGRELDLFTFSDLVGSGLPLFTPNGTMLRNLILEEITRIQSKHSYQQVMIPHITKPDLYKTSGHWDKFGDELFHVKGKENAEFVIKPMNCPHHTQIYASRLRSYRDLPLRYAEATTVYRDEKQGELLGLARVRSITQDDAHVFCTPEQIPEEIHKMVNTIQEFYSSFGMFAHDKYWVSLSVRAGNKTDGYIGTEKNWAEAEQALENAAKNDGLNYKRVDGEAAFYGPKLDFMFSDALGREWQLATIQLDFAMASRFSLIYKDKNGEEKTPVMIHRAVAGAIERFLSVIIEHFGGAFPLWLSPIQVSVLPISENQNTYARKVNDTLSTSGIRTELKDENDTLGKKIREVKKRKIPYYIVIGGKEESSNKITVETRDGSKRRTITLSSFIKSVKKEIGERKV